MMQHYYCCLSSGLKACSCIRRSIFFAHNYLSNGDHAPYSRADCEKRQDGECHGFRARLPSRLDLGHKERITNRLWNLVVGLSRTSQIPVGLRTLCSAPTRKSSHAPVSCISTASDRKCASKAPFIGAVRHVDDRLLSGLCVCTIRTRSSSAPLP
jgi:hypothetical protein